MAWYRRIGPGLITACVVIGPGSIMTSSRVGANEQYAMLWVVVVSVAFMLLFMSLGAKLGAVAEQGPCDLIRRKAGSWLAILVGVGVFFIATAFQSGNNIGVAAAFEAFIDSKIVVASLVILFNALSILFLFAFKDLYKSLERVMAAFVAIMLLSFAVNLLQLGVEPVAFVRGFFPSRGKTGQMIPILGLIGTTFVSAAAFFQAYLVRQKGWKVADLPKGLIDARVGSVIMFLITVMIMSTAAAGLYTGEAVSLSDPVEVATSLDATFGGSAKVIFCIGLFSAAYSSFLINSMIGGFMLADGLGLPTEPQAMAPKVFTTAALVVGMLIGLGVLVFDIDRTPSIIAAQAVTVAVAPLVAGVLLWLTSSRDVMGEYVNRPITLGLGLLGLTVLLALAAKTALVDVPSSVEKYRQSQVEPPAS